MISLHVHLNMITETLYMFASLTRPVLNNKKKQQHFNVIFRLQCIQIKADIDMRNSSVYNIGLSLPWVNQELMKLTT